MLAHTQLKLAIHRTNFGGKRPGEAGLSKRLSTAHNSSMNYLQKSCKGKLYVMCSNTASRKPGELCGNTHGALAELENQRCCYCGANNSGSRAGFFDAIDEHPRAFLN